MSTPKTQMMDQPRLPCGYGHTLGAVPGDPRLAPVADALRDLLAERRLALAEIDRRVGWANRYLSRILNGYVDMKLAHVLDVLQAAGIEPRDFWCRLCGQRPDDDMRRRLAALEAEFRKGS